MTVPSKFNKEVLELACRFADPMVRLAPLSCAHALCGKAGRLAQVFPEVRPFTTLLFTALAASLAAAKAKSREAPPNRVAVGRFRQAAQWLVALLGGSPSQSSTHCTFTESCALRVCVASSSMRRPGVHGALLLQGEKVVEFFTVTWTNTSAKQFGAVPGESRWQTFWEFATFCASCASGKVFGVCIRCVQRSSRG